MEALFDQSVPWYLIDVPPTDRAMRQLLVEYAGVEDSAVEKHITDTRSKAWRVAPFPCVGSFLFAELVLSNFPVYPDIVANLKSGTWTRYLEVGCGLGQDIRKLIHDGVPMTSVMGTDLLPGLLESGHDLFRDADALPLGKSLFAADFLDVSDNNVLGKAGLDGTVDVIHATMFLHCFDRPAQLVACQRVITLLKNQPGVMIVGKQGGVTKGASAREHPVKGPMGQIGGVVRTNFLHNVDSFKTLWDEVGQATGTRWNVQVCEEEVMDRGYLYFDEEEHRWLSFVIVKL
ncbi:methyltransferase domain-containing protein [Apiospora kogelbergensis]|uniref:Methyltransferase domain-containing protein n=1 Tax=Apiospora kogelbergensis TaxID=1337665 RepID=A0AAW0R797_9PEZI